jgi:flagellar hook-basal body complex protein FliE
MQMQALTAIANSLTNSQTGSASSLNTAAGLGTATSTLGSTGSTEPAAPFSGLLMDAIGSETALETQASTAVQGLIEGTGVDVHTAMIATQKASLAFELALSVRNKAVAAYQQVMGMQF